MADIDDIKLKLGVETSGAEGIVTLSNDLKTLAKEGGEAAPEFQRLAQEFSKIAEQSKLVTEFANVSAEVDQTAKRMAEASAKADALKTALAEQEAVLAQAVAAQKTAQQAVAATSGELRRLAAEQATLRATTDASEKSTQAYRSAMVALRSQVETQTAALTEQKAAQAQANAAVADAKQSLASAQSAYNSAASGVKSLAKESEAATASLESVRQKAQAAGVEASDLASAQRQVVAAMDAARIATEAAVQEYERAKAASARLAAQEKAAAEAAAFNAEARRRAAEVTYAALFDEIAAREKVAAAAKAASAQEQAESDRLVQIEQVNRQRMQAAALQQLGAERAAFAEAAALEERVALERTAAIRKAAQDAQQALSDAFKTAGVRSIAAIQAEIVQVQNSLLTLSRSAQVSAADFDRAWQAGQLRIKSLQAEIDSIPGKVSAISQVTGALRNQFVQLAAAFSAIEMGRNFIDANVKIESTRRALTLITGDSKLAAEQIEFLRKVADNSGQSFNGLSETFVKFSASATASGIPVKTMEDVFAGVASSAGKLGISTARASLMLDALSQMANKGVVSMEELRQQLGDSLPGAISIAAKGLGITEAALAKLVEKGELTTQEFFPAFKKGLTEVFGDSSVRVEGFLAAWNRLQNALARNAQTASESEGWKTLARTMDLLAENIGGVTTAIVVAAKSFAAFKAVQIASEWLSLGKAAKATAESVAVATVATEANTVATAANTVAVRESQVAHAQANAEMAATPQAAAAASAEIGLLGRTVASAAGVSRALWAAMGGLPGVAIAVALSYKELGTWIADVAARMTGVTAKIEANEAAIRKQDEALKAQAESNQRAAQAIVEGAAKINVKYTELIKNEEDSVVSKRKLTDAAKIVGEAEVSLAQVIGNEASARATALAASEKTLAASKVEQTAIQSEIALRQEQIKKLEAYVEANGGAASKINEAVVKQIKDLKDLLDQRKAEAEKITESTEALGLEVSKRKIAVETYKDNEKRVADLTEALKANREVQEFMRVQLAQGLTTQEAYSASVRRTAEAEALLNDALKDAAAAAERKISAIQRASQQAEAEIAIGAARVRTEQAYTETLMAQAKADAAAAARRGDVVAAVEAELFQKDLEIRKAREAIDAKEVELKVIRAKIDATNAEAKAILAAAEAEKAQLEATGALTEAKKAEIEARIAAAKLKQTESELLAENIKQVEEEIAALRAKKREAAEEAYQAEEGKDAEIAKRKANVDAINAETAAIQKKNAVDREGFVTDANGNRLSALVDTALSTYNTLKGYGVSDARAKQLADSLFDQYGQSRGSSYGQGQNESFSEFVRRLAEKEVLRAASTESSSASTTATSTSTATTKTSTTTTPVTINIPGVGSSTVTVASQADATALVKVFEAAFGRST